MTEADKTGHVKTMLRELYKTYITYDVESRPEYVYQAPTDADHGTPCMITRYTYVGTTRFVQKSKEYSGTWDSSYDI